MNTESLPYVNLRGSVLYPGMEMTITVGRSESVRALRRAVAAFNGRIVVITQRQVENNGPLQLHDMFNTGTVCKIIKSIFMTDATVKVHLEACATASVLALTEIENCPMVDFSAYQNSDEDSIWSKAWNIAYPKTDFDLGKLLLQLYRNEKTGVDALDLKLFNDAIAKRQAILDATDVGNRKTLLESVLAE